MKNISKNSKGALAFLTLLSLSSSLMAQDGEAGITAASDAIGGYFDSVSTLILAIGAIVGLIGAIRVYVAWNSGDRDVNRMIMGWFGACIFLVVVGLVLQAFFAV